MGCYRPERSSNSNSIFEVRRVRRRCPMPTQEASVDGWTTQCTPAGGCESLLSEQRGRSSAGKTLALQACEPFVVELTSMIEIAHDLGFCCPELSSLPADREEHRCVASVPFVARPVPFEEGHIDVPECASRDRRKNWKDSGNGRLRRGKHLADEAYGRLPGQRIPKK